MNGIGFLGLGALLVLLLGGCQVLSDWRDKILTQGGKTVDNVVKTAEDVGNQIEKTKQSVEKKVEDIQNAAKEVNEAVEAVKKVTEE